MSNGEPPVSHLTHLGVGSRRHLAGTFDQEKDLTYWKLEGFGTCRQVPTLCRRMAATVRQRIQNVLLNKGKVAVMPHLRSVCDP